MSERLNRQWVLASRPEGMVEPAQFELRESEVPEVGEGEFLVRNLYLSLDPAMRTWMTDRPSYVPPVALGEVMRGMCTAQVVREPQPRRPRGRHARRPVRMAGLLGRQGRLVDQQGPR